MYRRCLGLLSGGAAAAALLQLAPAAGAARVVGGRRTVGAGLVVRTVDVVNSGRQEA